MNTVLIGGSGRCGTHWILKLLLSHPDTAGILGETKIWEVLGPLQGKPDWQELAKNKYYSYPKNTRIRKAVPEDRFLGILQEVSSLPQKEQLPQAARLCLRSYMDVAGVAKVLVEKTPKNVLYAQSILATHTNAKFIEMVRDPRDTYLSFVKYFEEHGQESRSIEQIIKKWNAAIQAGMQGQRAFPDRWLRIRYEDLVNYPERTIEQVFDFCQLSYDKQLIHNILDDDTPINSSHKGVAGAYEQDLDQETIDTINSLTRQFRARFNYQ